MSILSNIGNASDFKVVSVFEAKSGLEGVQYMAVVRGEEQEYSGDHLLFFGEKEGAFKVNFFHLTNLNLYLSAGSKFEGYSESFYLKGFVLRPQKMVKIKFYKEEDQIAFEGTYCKSESETASSLLERALKIYKIRMQEIDAQKELRTLSNFKRALFRIKDKMGFYIGGDYNLGLPVAQLQSEQEWNYSMPKEKFRRSYISMSGEDVITSEFREAKEWTLENDIPRKGRGVYSTFREGAKSFTKSYLKDVANQFVRYEIINTEFLRCRQNIEKVQHFTWIFIDGSTFSYRPAFDCGE